MTQLQERVGALEREREAQGAELERVRAALGEREAQRDSLRAERDAAQADLAALVELGRRV